MNNNTALSLPNTGDQFISFQPDDFEAKVRLYNAINNPDQKLKKVVNKELYIKDVIVTRVEMSGRGDGDDATDKKVPFDNFELEEKTRPGYRVVIIDTQGVSYVATSQGIFNSVVALMNIFGTLHFDNGLPVTIREIETKKGNALTISINV